MKFITFINMYINNNQMFKILMKLELRGLNFRHESLKQAGNYNYSHYFVGTDVKFKPHSFCMELFNYSKIAGFRQSRSGSSLDLKTIINIVIKTL